MPVLFACALWGGAWHAHRVRCLCDNQVVVAALQSRLCRDAGVMHLLQCLAFVEAQIGCHLFGLYTDTHSNHLADDLSRNCACSFLSNVPSALRQPMPVAVHLLDLLKPTGMAPAVQRYFQEGLAASTRWTYEAAMRRFHSFCTLFCIHAPFPVTEQLLCSFAAYLADQGLSPQTIKGYLAAVQNTQISLGFPDPRISLPCRC